MASFVLWEGYDGAGPSAVAWLEAMTTAQLLGLAGGVVLLALLAGQWGLLVHLLRQNGRLLVRLEALEESLAAAGSMAPSQNGTPVHQAEGLPVGSTAPEFSLQGVYGETLTLDALRGEEKPVLLLFTDPGCGPCTALLPEIRRWQREHSEELTVSLVSRGSLEANRAKATEHGLRGVLLQKDWEVSEAYRLGGTPSAVLVSPEGTVASPVAGGAEAIRALVAQATGDQAQLPVRPQTQGQPCPNCGKVHPNNGNGHAQGGQPAAVPQGPRVGEPAPTINLLDLRACLVRFTFPSPTASVSGGSWPPR